MLRYFHHLVSLVDRYAQSQAVGLKSGKEVLDGIQELTPECRVAPHFIVMLGIPDQAVPGNSSPAFHCRTEHFPFMDFPYGHLYRCHQRRAHCGHDDRGSRCGNFRGLLRSRGIAPWNGRCRGNWCIGDRLTRLWFFQGQGRRRVGFRRQYRRSRYRCWCGYRFSMLRHRYRGSYRNCSRWRLRQIDLIALHQGRIGSNAVPSAEILHRYAVPPSYGCRSPGLSHRIGFYLRGLSRNRRRVWRFHGRFLGGKSLCVRRRVARQRA